MCVYILSLIHILCWVKEWLIYVVNLNARQVYLCTCFSLESETKVPLHSNMRWRTACATLMPHPKVQDTHLLHIPKTLSSLSQKI